MAPSVTAESPLTFIRSCVGRRGRLVDQRAVRISVARQARLRFWTVNSWARGPGRLEAARCSGRHWVPRSSVGRYESGIDDGVTGE